MKKDTGMSTGVLTCREAMSMKAPVSLRDVMIERTVLVTFTYFVKETESG